VELGTVSQLDPCGKPRSACRPLGAETFVGDHEANGVCAGCGVNVPYGFSAGGDLVEKVCGVDPQVLMGNAGRQITAGEAVAFQTLVVDNLLPSIDALLEHRPDLMKVGKRVIATILYQQEAWASRAH
jgi:hypothetical protein